MTRYVFPIQITDVIERKLTKHHSGFGKDAIFTTESSGWYLQINKSTTIYVGKEKPNFAAGDKANLIIERL